jgi:glutathione peroxidase
MTRLLAALLLWLATGSGGFAMSAFDFEFTAIDGKPMPMAQFKGKPVLLVNTASQCGYTPQYDGLQKLWEAYKDKGLVVLGVPSNDFGAQEPGSAAEIKTFCETSFGIEFPMTEKYKVIGPQAHPLYRWIAGELGEGAAPKWNFHKYLIAPDGSLAEAWPSRVAPQSKEVTGAVEKLLKK